MPILKEPHFYADKTVVVKHRQGCGKEINELHIRISVSYVPYISGTLCRKQVRDFRHVFAFTRYYVDSLGRTSSLKVVVQIVLVMDIRNNEGALMRVVVLYDEADSLTELVVVWLPVVSHGKDEIRQKESYHDECDNGSIPCTHG